MRSEFLAELKDKYPLVYGKPIRGGFYCPSEWEGIIDELSASISSHLAFHPDLDFTVDQVKEKFGGLRFYVSGSDEVIDNLIWNAEEEVKKVVDNLRGLEYL